jgi:diaminopimelate decarboxylase
VHARCAGMDISKKDAKVCVRVAGSGRRKAHDQFAVSKRVRRAGAGLERARAYVRAAQQTIGDIVDGVARGWDGQVGEDLRLLAQQCALVDELSGRAARTLAATSLGHGARAEPGGAVSADLTRLGLARSTAQAAARLATDLAVDQRRGDVEPGQRAEQRLRAEQSHRPARDSPGAIGVSR